MSCSKSKDYSFIPSGYQSKQIRSRCFFPTWIADTVKIKGCQDLSCNLFGSNIKNTVHSWDNDIRIREGKN